MSKSINEFAKEIHENAVAHGWWDQPRSFGEIIALCHSELSEALEADRAGQDYCFVRANGKPDGVAVEMADCIIRILDWFGYAKIDVEEIMEMKHNFNISRPYKHGKNY